MYKYPYEYKQYLFLCAYEYTPVVFATNWKQINKNSLSDQGPLLIRYLCTKMHVEYIICVMECVMYCYSEKL